jgi:hypothetical protein
MKTKNSLILDDEFIKYCELNNVDNVDKLAKEIFNRGFAILKYGETPLNLVGKEKVVEKEIIKEVPVEKIVEKIIEVEVIKEVPINNETIIKEVIKEVPVDNKQELQNLIDENNALRSELNSIKTQLDKFNKAKYLKNSDLSTLYDE